MAESFSAAERCDTCGSEDLRPWQQRVDGLAVLQCGNCRQGVVEALPGDLDDIYRGDYYGTDESSGIGYAEYEFTSEHSVGWAAALADTLRPDGGSALDIGCGNGLLLTKLGTAFGRRAGIEMNPAMNAACAARGLEMLAYDVYDPAVDADFGAFDVVTAVAVFEHVPQFKRAVQRAISLTRETGVLLFEVPLMSDVHPNDAWLSSSLEHLYYPTVTGLEHLFAEQLGLELHGLEVHVAGYASTFVGAASRDTAVGRAAGSVLSRVLSEDGVPATPAERRARAQALIIHAASASPRDLRLMTDLHVEDLTPAVLRRIGELWAEERVARREHASVVPELRGYLTDVEVARDAAQQQLVAATEKLADVEVARDAAQQQLVAATEKLADVEVSLIEAAAGAASWERRAHLTHEQLETVLSSTTWRAGEPVRRAVTAVRKVRTEFALIRQQVTGRRLATVARLARHGDIRTLRQRLTAVRGMAVAGAGLVLAVERGPHVQVVQEAWPDDLPLVSVVVVCFNYGAYVGEAVQSVMRQTLHRVEIILADGGSDDGTTHGALDELERTHPEVRVLRREGRHLVGDNRNFGIAAARGRYVCCLDADDLLEPVYLELAAYLLEAHNYDVVSTATRTFGRQEATFGLLPRPALEDMLLANNLSTVAVFRRTLWERSGGFHDTGLGPEHIHEDWKLWVRLAALGGRFINIIGQQLFLYRVHGTQSLSNLAGTPDLLAQRRAIANYNSDVVDETSLALSRARRDEVHDVEDPFTNLLDRGDGRRTVLLTLPFLIVGGAERLLSQIAAALGKRGWRIVVVTTVPVAPEFGDTSAWFSDATSEIYHLPRLLDANRWETFVQYLIEAKHVDVLWQAGSAFIYSLLPSLKRTYPDLKVVDLLFNTEGHTADHRAHQREIDLTFVENAEVEQWLLAHGEDPARVVRAESGVDLELYVPRSDRSRERPVRVGFSGRLSEEKDPLGFIAVARRLSHRDDIEFVITGAGPLESAVRDAIDAAGARVTFLGLVNDVREHLSGLDMLLLPSRLDGRPVVVLEALALGVPVIASRVGALPSLVKEGVSGFLCRPGQPADFVLRVEQLADDAALLERMSKEARTTAEEQFDVREMFEIYHQSLSNLVQI